MCSFYSFFQSDFNLATELTNRASKSIKFMLDNNLIDEKVYSLFLDTIFRLLLKKPVDLETVDKNWQAVIICNARVVLNQTLIRLIVRKRR